MQTGNPLKKRPAGVRWEKGCAFVRVWAPHAASVTLVWKEGQHTLDLKKAELGYWTAETRQLKPGDLYYFSLDGGEAMPDPASLSQPRGVHGPSQVTDLSFSWSDQGWRNPDWGNYIIYEIHTGTFSESGTFDGIGEQLDYLKELGVTAIELMPVAQFPGDRNWGYDGVFPFAVQHSYGGAAGLQRLVDKCHQKGLAVILDVVYNHLGPEGNYLDSYGPYFTDKYKTPWGRSVNFDDAYCDPVRRYFIDNALMWLRDFHVDALRLDAVHAIRDFSPLHILHELNHAVRRLSESLDSRKYLIAETDLNDTRFIRPAAEGGYGIQAQWCDEFHHALQVAAGQERVGYYSDFNGLPDLARALENAYVYTGQYSRERHRYFGTSTKGISGDHFVVFSQNHDQVGNRVHGERSAHRVSFCMQKLLAAVVLLSPFVPLLFMGEEWGASTPFPYFTSHTDKALIGAVEEGRKAEFSYFQKEGAPYPANELSTFQKAILNWQEADSGRHKVLREYYQRLLQLRKTTPALLNYDRASVSVMCEAKKGVLIQERSYKEQHLYAIYNFSGNPHEVRLKREIFPLWVLLSSSDRRWMGQEDCFLHYDHESKLTVPPESVILLANYHVPS